MSIELAKTCPKCGRAFKQHVSFSHIDDTIRIKVYRYKCPFCDALVQRPTPDEIRRDLQATKE